MMEDYKFQSSFRTVVGETIILCNRVNYKSISTGCLAALVHRGSLSCFSQVFVRLRWWQSLTDDNLQEN